MLPAKPTVRATGRSWRLKISLYLTCNRRQQFYGLGRAFGNTEATIGTLVIINNSYASPSTRHNMDSIGRTIPFADFALDAGYSTSIFGILAFILIVAAHVHKPAYPGQL
jgi:hypothetical protein